jgi:hypothetical protein
MGATVALVVTKRMKLTWRSGEMLIPCDGAFRPARANATDQQAARVLNVSLAVAR